MLEEIWLGGRESPQWWYSRKGDAFDWKSYIANQSELENRNVYCFITFLGWKALNLTIKIDPGKAVQQGLNQSVENWIESIVQLAVEYSNYNLFHFDRFEEIQVM